MNRSSVPEAQILAQLPAAKARSLRMLQSKARALNATFDAATRSLRVSLMNGAWFSVPVSLLPQLARATNDQIASVKVDAVGLGLHWDALDVDVSIVALAQFLLGKRSLLSAAGAQGGSVRSAAKSKAARANGLRGGRPPSLNVSSRPSSASPLTLHKSRSRIPVVANLKKASGTRRAGVTAKKK